MKDVFAITKVGDKSYWTRVGIAYSPNKDGSVNLQLNCVPLSGRLQIREQKSDAAEPEERT